MLVLALTFLVSFAASVLFTAVVRIVARRWGIVDRPDGLRKLHKGPVPLWGGVAVYLACLLGLLFARYGTFGIGERLDELAVAVVAAAGLVCVAGCIDDAYQLRSGVKLVFQVCSVLPIVVAGYCAIVSTPSASNSSWVGWERPSRCSGWWVASTRSTCSMEWTGWPPSSASLPRPCWALSRIIRAMTT